ncbi:MAG: glycosyltransferase family 4 protein [Gammaproteobacteria bacterium]|jgi:UDP-glucose:(heptosyl)LPS alpha-1,3-glucosyltransferase
MKRRPELLLIRQKYTPFGGAERFLERALDALAARGVQLSVIARAWQPQAGVELIPCRPFHIGRLWRDWAFGRRACQLVAEHPQALVQSHERLPCCDLYRAGDGTHRGWLRQRARLRGQGGRLLQALSPYHRHTLHAERQLFASPRLKAVICNSEMVRREIIEFFGVSEDKLHVIYNGVDTERFHPRLRETHRQAVREQWGVPDDAILYLFVGSGFARKGLDGLLDALSRQPDDAHLLVVGKDRELPHYRRLAAKLGIADRAHFTGPQPATEPFYGAADVLALPTLYDPFPNVIMEAMASSLPIVTSYQCGAADLIRDGENGAVCDALDYTGLADRLQALRDPQLRASHGEAMREIAAGLTLDAMSEKLIRLYEMLLARSDPDHG